ncbi:hypothetical protein OG756_04025 [Streptomyces sp. NBC_01310]|uniref:hypothetical protein n=1 Tax=Streptomyces sp. NBC_01310 TaxID=2903820 RepID=UPI0035B62AE1|nr:hypothetical protein OG756_04025 [Streptomyces sp. NBC_01310]
METWVTMAASVPLESENVSRFAWTAVQLRKTPVGAVSRDATGAAVLSPTAEADRTACGRLADSMSFTTPDEPESEAFAPGPLTDEVVWDGNWARGAGAEAQRAGHLHVQARGDRSAAARAEAGQRDLTGCLSAPAHGEGEGQGGDGLVQLQRQVDQGALLDAKGKWWRSSDARLSLTALIELPAAATPGPAQVAACNCLDPQLLEVTGERAD